MRTEDSTRCLQRFAPRSGETAFPAALHERVTRTIQRTQAGLIPFHIVSDVNSFGNGDAMHGHPSSEEVAAYLSNGLASAARLDLEAHLAECRTCRTEITSARRLMSSERSRKRQWMVPSAIAAAAAIVFFSTSSWLSREAPIRAANRASSGSAVNLGTVFPSDQAVVTTIPAFTWRADGPRALYQFSITVLGGAPIWLADTRDTTISLPAGISLDPNRDYLWNVDAIDTDGITVSTGAHRFRFSP